MSWFRKKQTPEERFWEWFQKNEARLFSAPGDSSVWMNELSRELNRVYKGLVWQVSIERGGKREFVISADGIVERFSAVESLADAAPPLARWNVVRFRPREPDYESGSIQFDLHGERVEVKGEEIECVLRPVRDSKGLSRIEIELYIPGCPNEDSSPHKGAAFILLDAALGEYDMECKVGFVGIYPFQREAEGKIRFAELREEFDRLVEETLGGEE